ncbi:MAG: putative DNA binding domain-containing protein [Elusimicrobia bacterium]|jgi:ATP-dependent DNA helicase RecG|nr:putative DNA binding domain-containing protein [Elusimicrobiota bacterium]
MQQAKINSIIQQGEGLNIEFKKCKYKLSNNVFETICAFLNRFGGELLLGVKDNGEVVGVDTERVNQIKKDFVAAMNNIQIINPTCYLTLEEFTIEDKVVLYGYIPESSQVQRCIGKIFDRNEDSDFDITENSSLATALYVRKQTSYSENKIYPYVTIKDFRTDLIERARKLAKIQKPDHPWAELDDVELLKSAQLYLKDYRNGKKGFTLASILLFGKDEVIMSVLPHHRTDAIVRIKNRDRYDDRDDIRTNLIESYDRIMSFVQKHLPDKFYLENEQRINIRDHIFREVAGNILIHREYSNPFPAKIIIEKNRVYAENSNKPHCHGLIDPENFSPFPKNPIIAKVFKEIGRADELGSGVRKLFRYCKFYSGDKPRLLEEDIFKTIIPLNRHADRQDTQQATRQDTQQVTRQAETGSEDRKTKVLEYCRAERTLKQIMKFLNLKDRGHCMDEIINPLLESDNLKRTIPDKPSSPNQKYISEDAY